jgi:SAM-dependent methyltransferase
MEEERAEWARRAVEFGRRCVVNLSIPEDRFESVTTYQAGILFPLLGAQLASPPASILDYGCGVGRFATGLLQATGASRYTGYDFTAELIAIARGEVADPRATFETGEPKSFLAHAGTFDLIWIHQVLGGVPDLADLARDICGCLEPGGLMFIAEATSVDIRGNEFWRIRKEGDYELHFAEHGVPLQKIGSFAPVAGGAHDVSVFAGKKSYSK